MRDYDPTTGRYLQADPLGLVDGASVYGYVKQSPMRFTDHSGLSVAYPNASYPGSTSGAYDAELCNVADEICRLMYEEDVPPKAEGGFPGKLCHYRCNSNGKWHIRKQLGTQPCRPYITQPYPQPEPVPDWQDKLRGLTPFIGPFAPGSRRPGGGGKGVSPIPLNPMLIRN
jgi:hypothetical protein